VWVGELAFSLDYGMLRVSVLVLQIFPSHFSPYPTLSQECPQSLSVG
jgi:hypothetical protein